MNVVRRLVDRWRASGPYSVSVPPMDGVLGPNQLIEESPVLVTVQAPDNLVSDGVRIFFSSGNKVFALKADDTTATTEEHAGFARPVAALAFHPSGVLAAGLDDGRIVLRGGTHDGKTISKLADRPLLCPTAIVFLDSETLAIAEGSRLHGPEDWQRDLMERSACGSVWRYSLATGAADCLADGLAYPYGLLPARDGALTVSESWRSRLLTLHAGKKPAVALADITGYPARLAAASEGAGAWLSVFAPRSQLVEFVLREQDFRNSMMEEIEPEFWIAPSLSATRSFLEPMQLGGLKQLGQLKAWAPTRSYGLVIGLDEESEPRTSFHSRADGQRHGITSCVESGGRLLLTSKGGDAIVSIPLAEAA